MGESTNACATLRSTAVYGWSFAALLSPRTPDCWPVASWMMHWD